MEGAALAGNALEPDPPAHEVGEGRADGEAEAGAAELPGDGAVGLGERLEDESLFFRGDAAAGVTDGEMEAGALVGELGGLDGEGDAAGGGELNGVIDQVDEDLAQPE